MSKSGEWRESARTLALDVLYVSATVLVITDWLVPHMRVGRLGLFLLLIALGVSMRQLIDQRLSRAWEAGKRSGKREAELEATAEPKLAVVKNLARRR